MQYTHIRLFFIYAMFFLMSVVLTTHLAFAQESLEEKARKYGVSFPITELGGCQNISECRTYCEDPIHANICINFAKSKGFYKEEKLSSPQEELLQKAQLELGCDSPASCQSFCHQESNFETCNSFAKKYGLSGGHTENPTEKRFLEKAKEILGCDSPVSCKTLCENETNREKCTQFAKEMGLRGGEHASGPGGCRTKETCEAFCTDPANYQVCSGFINSRGGREFRGPGGCNSEESCRTYCEAHKDECGFHKNSEGRNYDPIERCSKTPSCSWSSELNRCECRSSRGDAGDHPFPTMQKEFCRDNPEKCQPSIFPPQGDTPSYTPATECAKSPGCSWTGTTCQCQQGSYAPTTNESSSDPAEACIKYGCQWTNNVCQCGGVNYAPSGGTTTETNTTTNPPPTYAPASDPQTECVKHPECTWTGSTCQCSAVQGVSIERSMLRNLLEFLTLTFF